MTGIYYCTAMSERLKGGPVANIDSLSDVERCTGSLIAHGHVPPATLKEQQGHGLAWDRYVLAGIHILESSFSECSFEAADFRGSTWLDCTFENCNFRDSDWSGVSFHGCTFTGCVLTDIRCAGAEVSHSTFVGCDPWVPAGEADSYRNRYVATGGATT